jgi:hypothetical protein
VTIQLRYLQTLIEVSANQSSTIVFPLPIDVLQPLMSATQNRRAAVADGPESERLDAALQAAREALAATTRDPDPAPVESASHVAPASRPSALPPPSENDLAGQSRPG